MRPLLPGCRRMARARASGARLRECDPRGPRAADRLFTPQLVVMRVAVRGWMMSSGAVGTLIVRGSPRLCFALAFAIVIALVMSPAAEAEHFADRRAGRSHRLPVHALTSRNPSRLRPAPGSRIERHLRFERARRFGPGRRRCSVRSAPRRRRCSTAIRSLIRYAAIRSSSMLERGRGFGRTELRERGDQQAVRRATAVSYRSEVPI